MQMAFRICWRSYWRVWCFRNTGNICGKTPHQGSNATASVRSIVTIMAVRWRSGYHVIATGIFIHGSWRSYASGGWIWSLCRNPLHDRSCAGTGWRGILEPLWRALQQNNHFANAGLPSRRCFVSSIAYIWRSTASGAWKLKFSM